MGRDIKVAARERWPRRPGYVDRNRQLEFAQFGVVVGNPRLVDIRAVPDDFLVGVTVTRPLDRV